MDTRLLWNQVAGICDTFSPELKLLLLSSKQIIPDKELNDINQLLSGSINWGLFLDLAEHHRVYPLTYKGLVSLENPAVPAFVLNVLKRKSWTNAAKAVQMTGELINVVKAMEEKGIRVVILKGFPLGYKLYEDITLRPSKDLDILVWPEHIDEAIKVLEILGYERKNLSSGVPSVRQRNWMKRYHHFDYWHGDKEICLELHWQLGHKGLEIPLIFIDQNLVQLKISGQDLYILATEELLLFLVLHGAAHIWFRLKWLCDIAIILKQGEFSWEKLYGLAKCIGVEAIFNQAIILAHHLLQAPVPDGILNRISSDRKALDLATMVMPFITVKYEPSKLEKGMPLFKLRKKYKSRLLSWRKKVKKFLSNFLPYDIDMQLIPLPKYLYFLYYLIRPFTWFGRKVVVVARR